MISSEQTQDKGKRWETGDTLLRVWLRECDDSDGRWQTVLDEYQDRQWQWWRPMMIKEYDAVKAGYSW